MLIVGNTYTGVQLTGAPVGTKVWSHWSGRLFEKTGNTNRDWDQGGFVGSLGSSFDYTVEKLPKDEVADLALELYKVYSLCPITKTHIDDTAFGSSWRKVAKYVLENFDPKQPKQVRDVCGDVWTLRENGEYSIEDYNEGWSTLEEIEKFHGPIEVIR